MEAAPQYGNSLDAVDTRSGMTIMEVVIAMALVTMLVSGIYSGVSQGMRINFATGQHIAAFGLCKDLLETMRGAEYTSVSEAVFPPSTVRITDWGGIAAVPLTGTRSCRVRTFYYPPRKQVDVDMVWVYGGRTNRQTASGTIYFRGRRLTGSAGGEVAGSVNLNPNNSPHLEFSLTMVDGTVITRDDFLAGLSGTSGAASEVFFKPKGAGSQNSLTLNGQPFPLSNARGYLIQSSDMQITLYNSHINPAGHAVGQWHISITSNDALITVD